jgi:hypothetical protein
VCDERATGGVINWALSPREIQIGQLMVGVATAVFIGLRFVPARHRQRIGVALTVCYLLAVAAFAVYLLMR